MNAIETKNLTLSIKNKLLLDNISINVAKGCIYGLIGANGSGKSTILKSILGLVPSLNSKVFINDIRICDNKNVLLKIGSLIERPSLYEHLTAYDNLKIYHTILGLKNNSIKIALDLVGLTDHQYKKVKFFSLGMKQRLGIAIATLSDPEIYILDEPYNGLDQEGIKDLNKLILDLNKNKKTILLTSHILTEIEQIVSYLGIVENGKLIYEDSKFNALNALNNYQIRVDKFDEFVGVLSSIDLNYYYDDSKNIITVININDHQKNYIIEKNIERDIKTLYLNNQNSIEELYFSILKTK